MAAAARKVDPAVWVVAAGMALVLVALWAIPGLSGENARKTESEVRVCVMQLVMSDPTVDYDTAKMLCRQP
jgi:hypothetical protein